MASKVGAALGFGDLTDDDAGDATGLADAAPASDAGPGDQANDDYEAQEGNDADNVSSAPTDVEVLAMKAFDKAKTPKDKAAALKDFLVACGMY